MHDDRVPGGPLLGFEDAQDRRAIQRVGAETVNGFGRECNQAAATDELGGPANRRVVGRNIGGGDFK